MMTTDGTAPAPRVIAFHLPQFHPTAENDEWWGRGFTEWTNVAKARPRFSGHTQPHLPADLGYYDLRLREAREAQSSLARKYGIDGFLYYHYWFSGRRLLSEPVDRILGSGEAALPFALCWANETWSRRWDGSENEVLLQQSYSPEDDLAHIRHLATVFESERYIRIEGKPLFAVYHTDGLPDPRRTTDTWRVEAARLGVGELFLCAIERHGHVDPTTMGFDAAIEFAPRIEFETQRWHLPVKVRIQNKLRLGSAEASEIDLRDYSALVRDAMSAVARPYLRFPCVSPGWDNSARRRKWPIVYVGSTPELYEEWLTEALRRELHHPPEKLVFINAWNEWAEGNHLEPDTRTGLAFLEATARAIRTSQLNREF